MNIMLLATANNLKEAIRLVEEKCKEKVLFTEGSVAKNFLRYINYHLQEYDVVIIDKEVDSFETILYDVIDRYYGESLDIKLIIISTIASGEEMETELCLGSDAKYMKVDYTTTSWLHDLLKKIKSK